MYRRRATQGQHDDEIAGPGPVDCILQGLELQFVMPDLRRVGAKT